MASVAFTALAERAHHSPALVVRVTLPNGVGTGTTQFLFCDVTTERLALRLGLDVLPLLRKAGGVSTGIEPGKVTTTRGVRQLQFRDVPDWPESLGAGALASSGGSLFQRLQVSFPGWHRAKVEMLLGFDDLTLTTLADWEPLFIGQLEDWGYEGDNDVTWTLADIYELKNAEVPGPVGDDQVLAAAVTATAEEFEPSSPDLWLDPLTELPSQDWLAPVLVLRPDTVNEERVLIYYKDAITGKLVCVPNHLSDTEDFSTANWTVASGTWTRTPNDFAGPWGPENATHMETVGAGKVQQTATLGFSGKSNTFSIWMREDPADPGRTVRLNVEEDTTPSVMAFVDCVLGPYWKRYSVSVGWSGTGNMVASIEVFGSAKFYATQAQANRYAGYPAIVYAKPVGGSGLYAGRGAFGTARIAHPLGAPLTERAYYRVQDASADSMAEGLHPVWIVADLLNRAHVPPAWGDPLLLLSRFQQEADYRSGARLRRVLVDPQGVEDLIVEVCEQHLLSVWCDRTGYMKCRLDWRPLGPGTTWATLTREHDLHQRGDRQTGYRVEGNKASQANWVRVYWGLRLDTDGKEKAGNRPEDFLHAVVEADFDPAVVGADFRSLAGKTIYAKWFYQAGDARALAGRVLSRFKRGARKLWATVGFRKFLLLDVAESYRIDHPTLRVLVGTVAAAGTPLFQLIRVDYGERAEDLPCQFLESRQARIAHITPVSTDHIDPGTGLPGLFPNDYDLATQAQRDFYGFIGNTANKVGSSSDDGYVIG